MKTKIRKFFAAFVITLFIGVIVAVNVSASTLYWHFEWRGTEARETVKFDINSGSSITKFIDGSKIVATIDGNTSNRDIIIKTQYWTPGFLGLYGIAYEQTLYSNSLGNTGSTQTTKNLGTSPSYYFGNAKNNGSLKTVTSGANSAYFFSYDFSVSDIKSR